MRLRRSLVPSLFALCALLTACGSPESRVVEVKPREPQVSVTQHVDALAVADRRTIKTRRDQFRLLAFLSAVASHEKEQPPVRPVEPSSSEHAVSTPTVPEVATAAPSTASVMACIRNAESGDYAESSHPWEGSGAYQFVPGTWQHWFGQWRDAVAFVGSDYLYAYQAPPLIQDAVTAYTIENGGAGNWSPRYGADSCTVGMGG